VVVGSHAGIEAAVIGVDALEGKTLRRIETVIVGLFQLGFLPGSAVSCLCDGHELVAPSSV
jgi:hypothetical protein